MIVYLNLDYIFATTNNNNIMKTRNSIIKELEAIETQLKNMNVDCDQYGNFEKSSKYNKLSEREDELMQMLNEFPL